MSEESIAAEKVENISVKLLAEHTHNSITHPAGTVLVVNPADADFLCDKVQVGARI